LLLAGGIVQPVLADEAPLYTDTFFTDACQLGPRGVNDYYIPLIPGHYLLLAGEEEDDEGEIVEITVLIEVLAGVKAVDGVTCAIVREMEWEDDELVEISWNYFAICREHGGVFYFGEDVDDYEDGEVVGHGGAWLAGQNGARAGMIMPGLPLIGSRYYQEIAPGVAEDRAEHLDNNATVETDAGTFENCLTVGETSGLDPDELSIKAYARGVGLVLDDVISLVDYGRVGVGQSLVPEDDEEEGE
jgi:hypothetical protein